MLRTPVCDLLDVKVQKHACPPQNHREFIAACYYGWMMIGGDYLSQYGGD
jgi:hypothetical protein